MRKILLIALFLLLSSSAWARIFRWTGGGDGSTWKSAANWSSNDAVATAYPGTGTDDHVYLETPGGGALYTDSNRYPKVTGTVTIKSLTMEAGARLEIANGAVLQVTGNDTAGDVPRVNIYSTAPWSAVEPFQSGDSSTHDAVYYKGGFLDLYGTLDLPNGSILQTNGTIVTPGSGARIQAKQDIKLNNTGVTNRIKEIALVSANGNVLLKNDSVPAGGTLSVSASAGAAGGNIEITESGAVVIALGGVKTVSGGSAEHVYLSAGGGITQTGLIETPALQIQGGASGDIVLNGDNKAGLLAASTTGAKFSFTNADTLIVGSITTNPVPGGAAVTTSGITAGTGVITLRADAMTFNEPVGDYSAGSHVVIQNRTSGRPIGLDAAPGGLDISAASVANIRTKTLEAGSRAAPSTTSISFGSSSLPAAPYLIDTLILRCTAALSISSLGGSVTSLGVDCGGNASVSVNVTNLAVNSGGDVDITNSSGGFTIASLGSPAINGLSGNNIAISAAGAVSQDAAAPVVTAGTLTLGGTAAAYTLTAAAASNDAATLAGAVSPNSPASVVYTNKDGFAVGAGGLSAAGEVTLAVRASGTGTITVGGGITTTTGAVTLTAGTAAGDRVAVNGNISAGGAVTIGTLGAAPGAGGISVGSGAASINSGGSGITLQKAVVLEASASPLTISGTANPDIKFQGALDGARVLILSPGPGTVSFTGAVGASTPLGDGSGNAITIGGSGGVTFNDTLKVNGLLDITPNVVFKKNVNIDAATTNTGTSQLRGNVDIQGAVVINTKRSIAFGTNSGNTVSGSARLDIVAPEDSPNGTVTLNGGVNITGSSSGTPARSLYIDADSLTFTSISTAAANSGAGGNIFFRVDGLALSNIDAAAADVQITPRTDTRLIEFGDTNTIGGFVVYYNSSSFSSITAGSFTIGDTNHNGKIYLSGTGGAGIALTLKTKQDIEFTGDYVSTGKTLNLETSGGKVLIGGTGNRSINLKGTAAVPASITFNAPVEDAGASGTHGLSVTAAAVTFNKPVGAANHLGALAINHSGTFTTNGANGAHIFADGGFTETALPGTPPANSIGGNITTGGTNGISLVSTTTLTRSVAFTTSGGNIIIEGAVTGASGAGLTLAAGAGTVFLHQPVSLTNGAFSSSGTGPAYLGYASSSTSGNIATTGGNPISFGGDVHLDYETTLSTGSGAGNITITGHPLGLGAINGADHNLTLNAGTGNVVVGDDIVNLGSGTGTAFRVTAAKTTFKGDVRTGLSITSQNNISITGAVEFDSSSLITMKTTDKNSDIAITGAVTALHNGFVLEAHGTDATHYGTITLSSNISAPGDVRFSGDVVLTPAGDTITVTTTANNGNITFGTYNASSGGRVYGSGKNLYLQTHGTGTVTLNTDVVVGYSGNSAGTYALSVDAEGLTIAAGVTLDTSGVSGDMLFKINNTLNSSSANINAGAAPTGGDVRITPKTPTHTVEYGDVDTSSIVTDVYYSSDWDTITAGSFTVGDKYQTGIIYLSDVGQSPLPPSDYAVTIRSGGGSNAAHIVLAGDYTSDDKKLNLVIDNDDITTNPSPDGYVQIGYGSGAADHALNVGTEAIAIDAKIEGASSTPEKGLTLTGSAITIKNTVGAVNPLQTLTVTHSGAFEVSNSAHIKVGKKFEEAGTGTAVKIGGNITVIGVGSAAADNEGIVFAHKIDTTAGVSFTSAGTPAANADGPITVPNGILRSGGAWPLTLNADTGTVTAATAASASLGTSGARLGNVAITGGAVSAGPIYSSGTVAITGTTTGGAVTTGLINSSYASGTAVTVTNSGVFTVKGDITAAGGFSQADTSVSKTGTVEIAPQGTETLRTITTTAANGNITFESPINGNGVSGEKMSLTLNAGTAGTITFMNDVGNDASKPLGTGSGTALALNGKVAINKTGVGPFALKAEGNIAFGNNPAHTTTLTSGGTGPLAGVNVETTLAAGTITFNGPIDGGVDFAVTSANGDITFNGLAGGTTPVGAGADAFTARAAGTGTIVITKSLTAGGDIALNGNVEIKSAVDLAINANEGKIGFGTASTHTVTLTNTGTASPQVTIRTDDTASAAVPARDITFAGPVTGAMNLLAGTYPNVDPNRSSGEVYFNGTVDVGSNPKAGSGLFALKVDAEELTLGSGVNLITRYEGDVMMRVNGLDFMTGTHYLYAGISGVPGSIPNPPGRGTAQITTREEGMEIEYGDYQRYSSTGGNPVAFFKSEWTNIYAATYTIGDPLHYGAIYFTGVVSSIYEITVDNRAVGYSGSNGGIVRFEGDYSTNDKTLNLNAKGIEIESLNFPVGPSTPLSRPVYPGISPYSLVSGTPVTINLGTANLVLNAPIEGSTRTPDGDDSLTLQGGNITLNNAVGAVRALGKLTVNQRGTFTAKAGITANLGFTEAGTTTSAKTVIAPADNGTVTIATAGNPIEFKYPVESAGTKRSLALNSGAASPAGNITIESAVNLSGSYTQTCAGTAVIGTVSAAGTIRTGGDVTLQGVGTVRVTGTSLAAGDIKAGGNIMFQGGGTVTGLDTGGSAEIDTNLTLEAGTNYAGTFTVVGAGTTVNFNRLIVNANTLNNGIIRAGQVMGPADPIDSVSDPAVNNMQFGDGALPYLPAWINDFALIFNNGYSGSGNITGISANADRTCVAFRADSSLLGPSAPEPLIALSTTSGNDVVPKWLVFLGNITQRFDSKGRNVPNVLIAHEYHIADNPSSAPTGVRLDTGAAETGQTGERLIIWRGFLDLNGKKWRMIQGMALGSYPGTYLDDNGFGGYKGKLSLGKIQTNKPAGEIRASGDGSSPALPGGFTLWAGTGFTLELLANADPNSASYTPNRISSSGAVRLYPGYTGTISSVSTDCPGWWEFEEAHLIFTGAAASFETGLAGLVSSRPLLPDPSRDTVFSSYDDPFLDVGALTVRAGTAGLKSDISVQGNVTIEAGAALEAVDSGFGRYIVVRGGAETVPGGWYQYGTFDPGQSTVNFKGAGPNPLIVVQGNTKWYNFVCETNSAILEFSAATHAVNDYHEFTKLLRVWPRDGAAIIRMTKIMTSNPRFNAGGNHNYPENPTSYNDYGEFWHIKLDDSTARVEMYMVNVFYSYAKIPIALPAGVYANPYNESSTLPNWGFHFCMYWTNLKTFIYSFTEDTDGNGKIDRLRVQATLQITTPDFTGFRVSIEGYDIDTSRGSGGFEVVSHSMDSIYIYLKEKPYQDSGVTPRWRVLAGGNLRLNEYIAVEPFHNWMIAVDTAPPKVSYALMLPTGAASTRSDLFVQLAEPMISKENVFLDIRIPAAHDPYSGNRTKTNTKLVTTRDTYYTMEYLISFNKNDGFSVEELAKGEKYFTIENGQDLALPIEDLFNPANPQYPSPKYPKNWNYDSYVTVRGNSGRYINDDGQVKTAPTGSLYTDEFGNPIGDGTGYAMVPPNKLPMPAVLLPGAPPGKYSHRVTDVLVSLPPSGPSDDQYFMWPVWAKTDDSPTSVTVGSGWSPAPGMGRDDEYGLIWDFTGLRGLRDKDISLLGEMHDSLRLAGFAPSLFYAASVHDSFRAGPGNGSVGLWLPPFNQNDFSNIVPKPFTGAYQRSPDSGPTPPQYVFSFNNTHYGRGSSVEFFYRLDGGLTPLYAARLDMVRGGAIPEDWFRRIKPFSFRIIDDIFQRGGVTILNNVIDPTRGEKTYLEYVLNRSGRVTIQVFTLDGSLVQVLQRGSQGTGTYRISWDGRNRGGRAVARGMYFIRAVGPEFDETRKVMVVK
ncbi:MAG: hypothetical protein LBO80_02095 [Treponema sp.]|jgi:flagellar hook assembly protein FlgD|nr:hypothetical protein [Treponema sp.]